MSFEWRTDEDEGWAEDVKPKATAVSPSFWQRRRRFLLFMIVGLAAVWGVVQWQVGQRVAATTAQIERDLLATHNFVLQTAVSRDESLFRANLSGRDPAWGEVQKTLLAEGWLLDRPMFGWAHQAAPNRLTAAEISFEFSPDLRAAELLYPQSYAVRLPAGITETVTLQQTAVYRQGKTRWLFSPPDESFWGEWVTQAGEQITLVYPERDRQVATRLVADLDQLLAQLCRQQAELSCQDGLRVHLRLDNDPDSLLAVDDVQRMLTTGLRLNLPAPTLIGLPTDEPGYQALFQAYGVQVVTSVLAYQIAYDCCRHQLFFRAQRDYLLAELGLQAWPLDAPMFSQMLARGFNGDVLRHWTRRWQEAPPQFIQVYVVEDPDPIWQEVYALIAFLHTQETAVSPTEMLRLMDRNSFDGWLADVLAEAYDESLFETRFLEFIYEQSNSGQTAAPPIPLPTGKLTLVCANGGNGRSSNIVSYDLSSKTWAQRLAGLPRNSFVLASDGEHFLVNNYQFEDPELINRVFLATDEEMQLVEEIVTVTETEHWVNYMFLDHAASFLLRYENNEGEISLALRSLDCPTADCPEFSLPGWPTMSPDKHHLLVRQPPAEIMDAQRDMMSIEFAHTIQLGNIAERSFQTIEPGAFPFWLNSETFGFARVGDAEWEIVTAVLPGTDPRVILHQTDLAAHLPENAQIDQLIINQILANPANPQDLMIYLRTRNDYGPDSPGVLFRVMLEENLAAVERIELLRIDPFSGSLGFSPDGRYVFTGNFGYSSVDTVWHLLDLQTGETLQPITTHGFNFTWSPDGQWFIQDADKFLLLHAPAYDYQHFIPHALGDCSQVILSENE